MKVSSGTSGPHLSPKRSASYEAEPSVEARLADYHHTPVSAGTEVLQAARDHQGAYAPVLFGGQYCDWAQTEQLEQRCRQYRP